MNADAVAASTPGASTASSSRSAASGSARRALALAVGVQHRARRSRRRPTASTWPACTSPIPRSTWPPRSCWRSPHSAPPCSIVTVRAAWRQLRAHRRLVRTLPVAGPLPGHPRCRVIDAAAPLAFCAGWLRPRVYVSPAALERLSDRRAARGPRARAPPPRAARPAAARRRPRAVPGAVLLAGPAPPARSLRRGRRATADAAAVARSTVRRAARLGDARVRHVAVRRASSASRPSAWTRCSASHAHGGCHGCCCRRARHARRAVVALVWRASGKRLGARQPQPPARLLAALRARAGAGAGARLPGGRSRAHRAALLPALTAARPSRDDRARAPALARGLSTTHVVLCLVVDQLRPPRGPTVKPSARTTVETDLAAPGLLRLVAAACPPRAAQAAGPAPARSAPNGRPRHRVEPVPARHPGHARRPAGDRPPDLRAGDHARGDLRRGRLDRSQRDAISDGVHGPRGASAAAAADTAAHDTLVKLYPSLRASIDQQYAGLLAQLPSRPRTARRASASASRPRHKLLGGAPATARARRRIPFLPGHQPGRLPADAARLRPAGVHPLGARQAVRPAPRRPVPPAAAAGARRAPSTPPRSTRSRRSAQRDRLDADGRSDGDRPVLEPADLGDLEPHRADRRARRTRQPVAERPHVRGAEPDVRRRGDRVLRRQVHLPPVAAGDRDPRADTDGNPDTPPTRLDAALHHGAGPVVPRRARHDQRRRRRGAVRRSTATTSRSTSTRPRCPAWSGRSSASPRRPRRPASRIYNGNHTRIDQVAGENLGHDVAAVRAPTTTSSLRGAFAPRSGVT